MSGYKRVNYYELCRLCASNQEKEKIHIFEEEGRKQQLQLKIQLCLALEICEHDPLPKVVCLQCVQELDTCHVFRQACKTSETMLSSYFNNFRYTDDFKKSGKVYIKDTVKNEQSSPEATNVGVSSLAPQGQPVYTLQLPQMVTTHCAVQGAAPPPSPVEIKHSQTFFDVTPHVKRKEPPPSPLPIASLNIYPCSTIKLPPELLKPQTDDAGMTDVDVDVKVKPYKCEDCDKVFRRREHLYQHSKLHTGHRPFSCGHCHKTFMRKEHLLRHLTSHSGAKNFTCDICNKSFSRNDNLNKHRKTHEKQGTFNCEICQKQFVMKHYYLQHKVTHNEQQTTGSVSQQQQTVSQTQAAHSILSSLLVK